MNFLVAQPGMLHWLWLAAALLLIGALRLSGTRRLLERFADAALLRRLAPGMSMPRAWLRLFCLVGAVALIAVALADVRWGVRTIESKRRGLDVLFALDVSRSMLAEDATPNRLLRAKQIIGDVAEKLPGERLGLVSFAGDVAVACPLTLNHDAFRMSLAALDARDAGRGGSLVGDAIRRAAESFRDAAPEGKIIVLVSDGEDHGSLPADAAAAARRERGARVFTVGIGDEREGARIPIVENRTRGYVMHAGKEVWSKMDPQALAAIATAGEGVFISVGTASVDAGTVLQRLIAESERASLEGAVVRQWIPRFQWFAAPALLLLLLECLIPPRRAPVGVVT